MISKSIQQIFKGNTDMNFIVYRRLIVFFFVASALPVHCAFGVDISIYPYEPVVLSVPYSTNQQTLGFSSDAVITCPSQATITNQVGQMNLVGVSAGNSLFMLLDQRTNLFVTTGLYQVKFEGITKSIEIVEPTGSDINIVPILKNFTLPKIVLAASRQDFDADTKTICQQIISISPTGRYAIYARTYLAIDALYNELSSISGNAAKPDLTAVGCDIVSMSVPENNLKWTVLYHKGYANGMRQNISNANTAFTTLTNNLQNSVWSKNADKFLAELSE